MLAISSVTERRQNRLLGFAKKCIRHPTNSRFFTRNENLYVQPEIREREPFQVNFTRTEAYKRSTIPTCQRLLNQYFMEHPDRLGQEPGPGGGLRQEQGARERPAGN